MEVSIESLSIQSLLDRLHTATSEGDLLFVHYWIKELESRAEGGREAIRSGKHSWKDETVMQSLLKSDKHTFEGGGKVRKLIYWILIKYGAKFVENVLEGGGTGDLSVKWTDSRSGGDELRNDVEWLLAKSTTTEEVGDWIDKNRLRPQDSDLSMFTGSRPLPPPAGSTLSATIPPPDDVSNAPATPPKVAFGTVEKRSHSDVFSPGEEDMDLDTDEEDRAIENNGTPDTSRAPSVSKVGTTETINPPSQPSASLPPTTNGSLQPPLPAVSHNTNSLLASRLSAPVASATLVRLSPFPPDAGAPLIKMIKEKVRFRETPQRVELHKKEGEKAGDVQGFLLLEFETKAAARLGVEELKKVFQRNIVAELESDYQARPKAEYKFPNLTPVQADPSLVPKPEAPSTQVPKCASSSDCPSSEESKPLPKRFSTQNCHNDSTSLPPKPTTLHPPPPVLPLKPRPVPTPIYPQEPKSPIQDLRICGSHARKQKKHSWD